MADRGFAERARREAARYGGGPWVCVRELLQNARDARARQVRFTSRLAQGRLQVACRDDGDGMTFEHARRYLFRLYASSKDGRRGAAGRFGVGFWSVLAWQPERIVVRSWPRRGEPWEVELDGGLDVLARRRPPAAGHGTEVLLQRAEPAAEPPPELAEAVARYGRFLTRLDAPRRALDVRVDGLSVARPFDLPAPRLRFGGRGLRGVVALLDRPSVELLVRGLPVREAACLQDLLAAEEQAARAARPQLGGGLAPAALLDSAAVEVLLSRDDVRASRAVSGLVERAERELDHLIERQLDCLQPRSWRERLGDAARSRIASAALAVALAVAAGAAWRALAPAAPAAGSGPGTTGLPALPTAPPTAEEALVPYRDLGDSYEGAWGDEVGGRLPRLVALSYSPAERRPRLAALVVPDPSGPVPEPVGRSPAREDTCRTDCLRLELVAAGREGLTRLPAPSGEAVEAGSLSVDGQPARLLVSELGEPLVALGPGRHRVSYRTAAAPWSFADLPARVLGGAAAAEAERLRGLPRERRAAEALAFVRGAVRYSTEASVSRAHRQRALLAFEQRALAVAAGDCDVQNGLLAELLRAAGLPARLVVGHLGAQGRALPFLHAWVEWRAEDGTVSLLDASAVAPGPTSGDAGTPTASARAPASAAPGEEAPAPPLRDDQDRAAGGAPLLAASLSALLALALLAGVALVAWRWRRRQAELVLDRQGSLAELLRGVLENPRAFDHLPALLRRELLPALGRRRLALGPAWRAALRGQLFVSRSASPLAQRAARAGLPVLDGRRDEGRVVAEALGAVDLDEWQARLAAAEDGPLEPLNRHLRAAGERWRALVAPGLGAPRLLTLPGARARAGERADRVLLVDAAEGWLAELAGLQRERPAEALLAALARLGPQAGLPPDEQLGLLRDPAEAALAEAAP